VTDARQRILAVNPAFTVITGYAEAEVTGAGLDVLQPARDEDEVFQMLRSALGHTGRWQGEVWKRRKGGEPFRARMAVTKVGGGDHTPGNYVIVFSDVTRLRHTEEQLDLITNYDPLTGLANRNQFRIRLQHALLRVQRDGHRLAVVILDIDRFRAINDALGQALGDQLLRLVGGALSRALRPTDLVARPTGDEFAINLSILQLEQGDLVTEIHGVLENVGIDPARLELELTESMIMRPGATFSTGRWLPPTSPHTGCRRFAQLYPRRRDRPTAKSEAIAGKKRTRWSVF
jgi:diguanylate cyclase (GGDEF)-like protein/PAS domain S-box-containing protein